MPRSLLRLSRSAHGNAREHGAVALVETPPIDALAEGIPAPIADPAPARNALGHYQAGHPATRAAAAAAGRSKRDRTKLAHTLSVTSDNPALRALLRSAECFRRAQVGILAQTVGGGQCGPAPAALVASAALALAGSRHAYTRGDLQLGARLAEVSVQFSPDGPFVTAPKTYSQILEWLPSAMPGASMLSKAELAEMAARLAETLTQLYADAEEAKLSRRERPAPLLLSIWPGANPTQQAINMLRATRPGFRQLDFVEQVRFAGAAIRENRTRIV